MMETNLDIEGSTLKASAQRLMDAALDYWQEYRTATGGAAVVWVKDTDGRAVVLTRGEYLPTLMKNIDILRGQEPVSFGDR